MSDVVRQFADLLARINQLARSRPDIFAYPMEEAASAFGSIEPVEVPDDSPMAATLAETADVLQDTFDEAERRINERQVEKETISESPEIQSKLASITILTILFLVIAPEDAAQAANILLCMAKCAQSLLANVKVFTNEWSGIISTISFIIALTDYFKNKDK
jgi:hypothetical protein